MHVIPTNISLWLKNLLPDFQLTYKNDDSTETSLIKITNDILWAMENQRAMIVILVDFSAAFDRVDHNILINILKEHYGFHDKALHWFEQYLRPHNFKVCIKRKYSKQNHWTSVYHKALALVPICSPVTALSSKTFHMTW